MRSGEERTRELESREMAKVEWVKFCTELKGYGLVIISGCSDCTHNVRQKYFIGNTTSLSNGSLNSYSL